MRKYFDFVQSGTSGRAVPGASITVTTYPGGATASLFTDAAGTIPASNPLTTDKTGYYEFYTADGAYNLQFSGAGMTTETITNVQIYDITDVPLTATLAASSGSSLVGFLQAGTGAVATTLQSKAREWVTPQDFMTDAQKADVAARTRTQDVTAAILKAYATSSNVLFLPGDYKITMVEGTPLLSFLNQSDIQTVGYGANLYDPHVYTLTNSLSPVFQFKNCQRIKSIGLNYIGVPLASPDGAGTGIGYNGATFFDLLQGSADIEIDAYMQDLRYGVKSGNYPTPTDGYNKHFRLKLRTLRCGYPQAHYLAEDVKADIYAEGSHRSSYLAGVKGFEVNARFKDQHIAPVQVLMTDATTNGNGYPTGASRGCSAGRVWATDMGSTTSVANSWAVGIAPSRVDPGTTYEDIEVHVNIVSSDTVASTLGMFLINSSADAFETSYPFNWEQTIYLKNIRLTGLLDRSAQTIATHGTGEIYIQTVDTGTHYASISGLDFTGVKVINGSGANPRDLYCQNPGLVDQVNYSKCNFGTYTWELAGPADKPYNFTDCAPINRFSANTSNACMVKFRNTDVAFIPQPTTNVYYDQSNLVGAGARLRNVVQDVALTGASVSLTGIIPPGALLLGVEGKLTGAITGASGYQVGVSGGLVRFADRTATALGDTFTPQNSATTEVGTRYYRSYTDVVVTAKTANFTGGTLRVAVQYITFTAPS